MAVSSESEDHAGTKLAQSPRSRRRRKGAGMTSGPRQAVKGGGGENWAAERISGCGPRAGKKSAHAQVCFFFSFFILFCFLFEFQINTSLKFKPLIYIYI